MHGTDPLNVRLAAKIEFGQSKFRTLRTLYNLPSEKKENLLFTSYFFGHFSHYHKLVGCV